MPQSVRRLRRAAAPRSSRTSKRFASTSRFEALAFAFLGLAACLGFGLSSGAREWVLEALGYGWIPAAVWVAAAYTALRYHRPSVRAHWRWWVLAAAAATICIGVLSVFRPGDGFLAETSLSGRWGGVVGGTSVSSTLAKLAGVSLLTPLLVFPRVVGSTYLRVLQHGRFGLQFASSYVYTGLCYIYYFLDWRVRLLLNRNLRQQSQGGAPAQGRRRLPAKRRSRSAGTNGASPQSLEGSDSAEGLNLWADTQPGAIPSWLSPDGVFQCDFHGEAAAEAEWTNVLQGKPTQWRLPSINLLSPAEPRAGTEAPLEKMARHVERTLAEHGVMVEVKDIKAGPRIVRFGLVPGWITKKTEGAKGLDNEGHSERNRVKVQSILMREKDLALALQTPYLRIEAPVPGEALVGLEVPSPSPSNVHLRGVMETPTFGLMAAKGGLPIALGQDTGGAPVVADLTSMPHMLIAGATGSGKSVCINSVVATLLLTKRPDQLRLMMVDPKRVELTPFNGIPHLIMPVIVDVDQVNVALRGLMREMLRRYKQMEEVGARNITIYNKKVGERFPYLVLVVDELADLMIAGGFQVEQNLVRLAQLGRATGIHLVLATQRPSVNVVTGLLKANIPTRAAFAVASQVDSRVILDTIGAEKLLGRGDMLLLHNESPKPRRIQGTLVYDEEIDKLVEHWSKQSGPPLPVIPMEDVGDDGEEDVDERLMNQARDLALRNPRLSASFLERQLKIGGSRATQIIELLEDEGNLAP